MQLMEVAAPEGKPRDVQSACLSDEEVGSILKRAQYLASWVKKLEAYATNRLMEGAEVPGWKLVEGRSNRAFSDTDAAFGAVISAGYDRSLLYEEKPVTLTEAEKLIDKDTWKNVVADYIVKPPGKPTLVPADDHRPEYKIKPSATEAFGGSNQYKEEV